MNDGKPGRNKPAAAKRHGKETERRAREAEALKRNLARRKAQRRARAGDGEGRGR